MIARLLLASLIVTTCASCGPKPEPLEPLSVRWPASAPVSLDTVLRTPLIMPPEIPSPPGMQALIEPLPEDSPGVRIRGGKLADLYFIEVILGEAGFDDPLPMVVLLHGRGDRPRVPGGPFAGVPTAMRLIMPRAPRPLGQGFSWLPVSITQGKTELLASSLRTRAHHIAALIEELRASRPTLGRPVLAGFSQGAMLSFAVALLRPEVVGHAFPLAGWVPPPLMPTEAPLEEQRVPIRTLHGTADAIIPVEPTRGVVGALASLGWAIELLEFEGVGHVITPEMNDVFEDWLEAALALEAPGLGGGLGREGREEEAYEPYERLEEATIQAIRAQDQDLARDDIAGNPDEEPVHAEDEAHPSILPSEREGETSPSE